jgi:Holliday junction resolvase RusA-like endonuclease
MQKKIIFNITPQTHVRATQGDRIFFKIPRDKLRPAGLKRLMRLERYNEYKISVAGIYKSKRFSMPDQGIHVEFFIPVPKTWKKYKKAEMHNRLHQSKPDWDNLAKAFFDSIMDEDKTVADVRVTKRWVNEESGRIEVNIGLPEIRSTDVLI